MTSTRSSIRSLYLFFALAPSAALAESERLDVDWKVALFQNNPGIVTTLVTAFLLPIALLVINNRKSNSDKELDAQIDLSKTRELKKIDRSAESFRERESHESIVYSALVAILFEVQKLHIRLSAACVDFKCLNDALNDFQTAFETHQSKISENQLFMSSKLIGCVYSFYQEYGILQTELTYIQDQKNYALALPCVYSHSVSLADEVIRIQEMIVMSREDLKRRFNATELEKMKYCCGREPPAELIAEYESLKLELLNTASVQKVL